MTGRRLLVVSHPAVVSVNQEPYRWLLEHGWEVEIVVPARWRHGYRDETFGPTVLDGLEGRVHPMPVAFPGREQRHLYRARVGRVLDRLRPDAVLLEEETYAVAAFQWGRACHRRRVPFGVQADENQDRRLPFPARRMHRWTLDHAALVTARSRRAADLCRDWGARGAIELVPHHIADASPALAREHPFTVGYAGRFVPEKGIADLVAAVERMSPPPRLLLVGNGPMRDELAAAAQRGAPIELLTAVPHERMAEAYSQMDVLVLPSRTTAGWAEQFGRVLAEAMACGVPVIGSDSGEIPNVVETTRGGWVFPEGDVDALASLLEAVRLAPEERARRAAEGRRAVADLYSVRAVGTQLDRVMTAVVNRR